MKREFLDYVDDVIDAMSKAQEFTRGMDLKNSPRMKRLSLRSRGP